MIKKIKKSISKFNLDLEDKIVLTEAATGNYVITPIIAALAGAKKVYALTKDSKYGSVKEVCKQTNDLAKRLNVNDKIKIVLSNNEVPLDKIDILTNTGFNRPINKELIEKLSSKCVIPLMWEPWEFREDELDLEACHKNGIKVYGTNESDTRLKTMDYIGYIALYILLKNKRSPFSSKILVIGCEKFVMPIVYRLEKNDYDFCKIINYKESINNVSDFNTIIIADNLSDRLIIGKDINAFIQLKDISKETLLINIAGNINCDGENVKCEPKKPKDFPYMSFTTDFIDSLAVIDLHTASLKVAEGMLKTNRMNLNPMKYRNYMELNYPALAFNEKKYW
jgi:hypothetical protein